ncbi:hypothetical protein [Natronocalculus amylovorans]|uniref:DUF7973 domain-containing protein n=1 Tax=Natronocalculus amylovorans TaxID=2917812 RepID=A0AAE3K932_9EURY|nr:hypothetical protein [Natronocalculus amylovorans]MCL9817135.1 hypothetical protein [Natronocalculus amylovorans]
MAGEFVVLQFGPFFEPQLWIAAFAGGLFGAALGALPAFIFTGFMVIAGEAASIASGQEAVMITDAIAFGPVFGPHIAFAGGAAATAYAAQKGYIDTDFGYHEGKNILYAFGTHQKDVLVVGGLFGILGFVITTISAGVGLPWDPIAVAVVLSAIAHRAAFGYDIIGEPEGDGYLDMEPFENEQTDGTGRLLVEPWLPHQYEWAGVGLMSFFVGVLGAFIALETGSPFLAFGISAASLVFLNCGVEKIPVTHHITLPASTAALAAFATFGDVTVAVIVGAVFGFVSGLFGEFFQRIFYAHGDTHVDPPAAAIVFGTFLIAVFALVGIFDTAVWVPGAP